MKDESLSGNSLEQVVKDIKNQDTSIKILYYASVDLDTYNISVEESPANRKTEINAIGCRIKFFDSLKAANRWKRRFEKRPDLLDKYLKSF